MVKTEEITLNDKTFIHSYSDSGMQIQDENGDTYFDAIDVISKTYIETDIPIDSENEESRIDTIEKNQKQNTDDINQLKEDSEILSESIDTILTDVLPSMMGE